MRGPEKAGVGSSILLPGTSQITFSLGQRSKRQNRVTPKGISATLFSLGLAFDNLYAEARKRARDGLVQKARWRDFGALREIRDLRSALKIESITKQLDALTDTVNIMLLGVDPTKFRRFSMITPMRYKTIDGKLHYAGSSVG